MMKKTLPALLIALLAPVIVFAAEKNADIPPDLMQANPVESCKASPQEREGIIRAIEQYINAGRKGDSKIAQKGLSDAATMSWSENNALNTVP